MEKDYIGYNDDHDIFEDTEIKYIKEYVEGYVSDILNDPEHIRKIDQTPKWLCPSNISRWNEQVSHEKFKYIILKIEEIKEDICKDLSRIPMRNDGLSRSSTSDDRGQLPYGWKTRIDFSRNKLKGVRMYYNRGTGETSWHRPYLRVVAVKTFVAEMEGDLGLRVGDCIIVTKANPRANWWRGYIEGNRKKQGIFPRYLIKVVTDEPAYFIHKKDTKSTDISNIGKFINFVKRFKKCFM
jgi:hypothetical protein